MRFLMIMIFILASSSSLGLAKDRYPFSTEKQQQQFERIINDMRCMVCQNQNLADSSSGFADDMRSEIYKMVVAGKSDRQVIHFMVKRYGYFVSFDPPFYRETYLLWLAPLLLLAIAFLIGRSVYKKYRGS